MTERQGNRCAAFFALCTLHLALCTALCALLSCAPRQETRDAQPRNLLLVTLDTMRADRLGAYGYTKGKTPALDALARRGVRFDQAIAPAPLTLPAHATILSGLTPVRHGVHSNGSDKLPPSLPTLASVLSGRGYRTGAFVGSFVLDRRFGLARGFETYDDEIERDPSRDTAIEAERRGETVVDRFLAWMRAGDARPFFGWVHLYDAHAPYAPPAPFTANYDGEVAYVDRQVERILEELERRNLMGNTVVAIVGDHGEALGEHGELTHGLLLYESTLRVPLIIVSEGTLPAGHLVRTSAGVVDLAPTLAALAGHAFGGSLDGRDLSAELRRGQEPRLSTIYSETRYPSLFGWDELEAMRRGALKLMVSDSRSELFDLTADPGENRDLAAEKRKDYHSLMAALAAAKKQEVVAPKQPLDDETRAKLASLGYVSSSTEPVERKRADPRTRVALFRQFEEALKRLGDARPAGAIPILDDLVRQDPANPTFRSTLGRAVREAGDLSRAIVFYRDAVGASPRDPEGWYNLAVALGEAGRGREAVDAATEAVRLDPSRPEALNALGISLAALGRGGEARAAFEKAIALDPRDARTLNNLGNVLREMGEQAGAAGAYGRAIALAPRYPDPLNGLGTLEVARDRFAAAIPYFTKALEISPGFLEARLNRGIAYEMSRDRVRALEDYERVIASPQSQETARQRSAAKQLRARLIK